MKITALPIILIVCLISCKEDEYWRKWYGPWTKIENQEEGRVSNILLDHKFIFFHVTNNRGDDLLAAQYACLTDDTLYFTNEGYEPYTSLLGSHTVKIAQGVHRCVWNSSPLLTAPWLIQGRGYDTKDGNTDLVIPMPFSSDVEIRNYDSGGPEFITHHYDYSPVGFNKLNLEENFYTIDTIGILTLARRVGNDWNYFYLMRLN